MIRVYIAGPLGLPSKIGWWRVLRNVWRAMRVAVQLVRMGFSPMVPHTNALWPGAFQIDHAAWVTADEAWLLQAHAVLRLPGLSVGADREVAFAKAHGIPVFYDCESRTSLTIALNRIAQTVCLPVLKNEDRFRMHGYSNVFVLDGWSSDYDGGSTVLRLRAVDAATFEREQRCRMGVR